MALPANITQVWRGLPGINTGRNKFYSTGPWREFAAQSNDKLIIHWLWSLAMKPGETTREPFSYAGGRSLGEQKKPLTDVEIIVSPFNFTI
jgi:hypothetical protein